MLCTVKIKPFFFLFDIMPHTLKNPGEPWRAMENFEERRLS